MFEFETFIAAYEIADMAFRFWSQDSLDSIWLIDCRKSMVNSMYNVTKQGIFLEINNSRPSCLYTPWGEWSPWGNGVSSKKMLNAFIKEMIVRFLWKDGQRTVYGVLQIGDSRLSPPRMNYEKNYNPEKLKAEWEKMKKKYEAAG